MLYQSIRIHSKLERNNSTTLVTMKEFDILVVSINIYQLYNISFVLEIIPYNLYPLKMPMQTLLCVTYCVMNYSIFNHLVVLLIYSVMLHINNMLIMPYFDYSAIQHISKE